VLLIEFRIMRVVSRDFKMYCLEDMKKFLLKDYENYARKTLMVCCLELLVSFDFTISVQIWALSTNKFRLSKLFWKGTNQNVSNALMAEAILGEFSNETASSMCFK
jgi:predicted nuclease of restriction endonuclease-like (RecB) superfamily